MANFLKYLSFPVLALLTSCAGNNLISDRYQKIIDDSFNERKSFAINRDKELFTVFNNQLSPDQSRALKFLYAFMPLSDLADYNGDFFLQNVDIALQAKSESAWGRNIPEDIFLHYVLPCRINNENLDSFRIAYYNEIKERVKGMYIGSAALEINHWCQEKVTYQPSDIRTSAPVSTILSARGRCGEESTLAVAALRTAGIPSRQVYTPRWAHTDDNHAWVEVWINGEWFYMGACEPEPVLDRGWFTEYARRAMLVHTKSFGASTGGENVIRIHRNFTEVNNLSKYAPTKKIYVKVLNPAGEPDKKSTVEYQLYNYAEFYPLAALPVDEEGISSFETGLGDLIIWAYDGDDFAFKKISVSETDTLILKLNQQTNAEYNINLDLNIPPLQKPFSAPSADLVKANIERINKGKLIRQEYIDSWIKPREVVNFALK
ncbi:MAG: transglutaminase-like domain-containing protein, partial [Methanococcaceae archaeon]